MRKVWKGIVSVLFVVLLMLPFATQDSALAATKVPTLNKTTKTLTGVGSAFTLQVKNQPKNTKLSWKSSKEKVADVNGLGQVTARGKGTTTITCLVTYSDNSYVKLTCKVTVKVPATSVSINNAKLVNNAHNMLVGDTYDFNRTLVPKGSSDKTYWEIKDPDLATVDKNGVVQAVKAGVTQLIARSGKDKTAALDSLNDVTDAINIIITDPISSVQSVVLSGDREVTITFTHAMQASTLIKGTALNQNNITVEAKTSSNGVKAADLGNITPTLSADGKVLKLTTTNKWDGVYGIKIENDIVSQAGITFKGYNEEFDFSDKLTPALESVTLDDTGFVVLIKFNKEISIGNLAVSVTDSSLNTTTKTVVTKVAGSTNSNYALQSDNKTIQLDLSGIAYTDYNKSFKIYMTGIVDTKGNPTSPYVNEFYVNTDTSTKPNANLIKVERTGKSTFTAYFDKSIQFGGQMTINNYTAMGVVNTTDKKTVTYSFDSSLANTTSSYLTGTLYAWRSYNSITTGTATNFYVDMSVGFTPPVITNQEMVSTMNNNTLVHSIVLTYNKDVTVTNKSGQFVAKYVDSWNNVQQLIMNYTATAEKNVVKVILEPTTQIGTGGYTITLPAYFVYDSYSNYSEQAVITVTNSTVSSVKLPAPTKIEQDTTNPSIFYVSFGTKVDLTTAGAISSYKIDTKNPITAEVMSNSANGAVVKVTFAPDTIPINGYYPFYVQNITGDNGAYQAMDNYYAIIELKENVRPVLLSATFTGTTITLKFSEKIQGTAVFSVTNYGTAVALNATNPYFISDNTVFINLAQTVVGSTVTVIPGTGCSIKDAAGNAVIMADIITATIQ